MAGPVASVLIPAKANISNLEDLVRKVGERAPPVTAGAFDVRVRDTRPIGGDYVGDGRPFVFELEHPDLNDADRISIVQTFGFEPQHEIVVVAMCGAQEDHRILATMVLHLARTYCGVVNFDGALLPAPLRPTLTAMCWDDVRSSVKAWVEHFRGKIIALPYATADGRTWASHVADAEFLSSWLQSPDFHMVK